jgi:hypothetical protein
MYWDWFAGTKGSGVFDFFWIRAIGRVYLHKAGGSLVRTTFGIGIVHTYHRL